MCAQTAKPKVAVVKYDGTSDSFARALELCGGLAGLKPGDRVLLKPNVLWGGESSYPPFGRITTSAAVGHMLEALRNHGCRDLFVGEGTIPSQELGSTTARGFAWSGIDKVARKYGATLVDFNAGPFEEVQLEGVKVRISRWALDGTLLIDMPVLKTHLQTKISLGMKNLKGCLAIASKKRFHRHNLHHMIALLNTKIKPALTVIDGIYGLERGPELLGRPRRMNVIIAGSDVFSCDIVGSLVMGIPPEEVEYLRQFASLTGRSLSVAGIDLQGEPLDAVSQKLDWHLSLQDVLREAGVRGVTIQDVGTSCCTGCAVLMSGLTAIISKDCRNTDFGSVEICLGSEMKAKKESGKVFLLGDCAVAANKGRPDATAMKGCPPPVVNTVVSLLLKSLPPRKAAPILVSRAAKKVGMNFGLYHEVFPAYGVCNPPEFDRRHF